MNARTVTTSVGPADFTALLQRARQWATQASAAGFLDEADLARFAAVEAATPADLFCDQQARPLVVAFFGGTGVGKSSLLNRLAGAAIARTGVERPTSHEATVYVHESVALAELPPDLPTDTVQVRRHSADAQRGVLWLDAPDIDSTAEENRRAALAWLPHVDLVCYVVSPERYRDDVGWRVLQQRGHKHGWLFVLNRWDEGDPQQATDFARMLNEAGFEQPLLLRTCCRPGRALPSPDEFDQLALALDALLKAHGVRELTRLGHRARGRELAAALEAALRRLGDEAAWAALIAAAGQRWDIDALTISEGAEWSIRALAARFAASEGGLLVELRRGLTAARGTAAAGASEGGALELQVDRVAGQLWDDWMQAKLAACCDALELAHRRAGLCGEPLRRRLDEVGGALGAQVAQHLRDRLRTALARPGTGLTRLARRATGFLMGFLPLLALVWVAWAVVVGYYRAVHGTAPYRGVELAVHSLLVVAIAWAVPFILDRLLRPSMERTVGRALRAGLRAALDDAGAAIVAAVRACEKDAASQRAAGQALLTAARQLLSDSASVRAPVTARLISRVADASCK